MNRNLKMLTLAALSSMSVSALAITVTAPRPTLEAPVIVRPTVTVKPGAVAAPKAVLPGTAENLDTAQANGMLNKVMCDGKKMYAELTEGTNVAPDVAQRLVAARIIQIAGNSCGKEAASMSVLARNVLLNTALCAEAKGIASVTNAEERATILGGCQAGVKRQFGMMEATDVAEIMNVKKIANDCHYYSLAI